MSDLFLKKDEALPLPDQISRIIGEKIRCGEYKPGKKLKTIRQYAQEFSVSPVTVIRALDMLEEETLIERVPVKGIFVSENVPHQKRQLTACFAFPEKEMTFKSGASENWCLNFELFQGLFCGSHQYGVDLQFAYFADDPSPELLRKQLDVLKKFDFVIFTGYQLQQLQKHSALERLTFDVTSWIGEDVPGIIKVDYNREKMYSDLTDYLIQTGCRSAVAVIGGMEFLHSKAKRFLENARQAGVEIPGDGLWNLKSNTPDLQQKITAHLQKKEAEFIFVDTTDFVTDIYEAAFDIGMIPNRDFIITGIASGQTFASLFPKPSYFKIPRFDMGMQIMEYASKRLRDKDEKVVLKSLEAEFIQGKDLRNITNSLT